MLYNTQFLPYAPSEAGVKYIYTEDYRIAGVQDQPGDYSREEPSSGFYAPDSCSVYSRYNIPSACYIVPDEYTNPEGYTASPGEYTAYPGEEYNCGVYTAVPGDWCTSPGYCIVPITEEQGFLSTPGPSTTQLSSQGYTAPSPKFEFVPGCEPRLVTPLMEQPCSEPNGYQHTWSPISLGQSRHTGITQMFRDRFRDVADRSSSPELRKTKFPSAPVFCTDQEQNNPMLALVCDIIVQNLL